MAGVQNFLDMPNYRLNEIFARVGARTFQVAPWSIGAVAMRVLQSLIERIEARIMGNDLFMTPLRSGSSTAGFKTTCQVLTHTPHIALPTKVQPWPADVSLKLMNADCTRK